MGISIKFGLPTINTLISNVRELDRQYKIGFAPAFKKASVYTVASISRNFREEGRPEKWKELSPLTIMLRRKGKGSGTPKILRDTGRLFTSISPFTDDKHFGARTAVTYARLQHYGGKSEPRNVKIKGHTRVIKQAFGKPLKFPVAVRVKSYIMKLPSFTIPARPYMMLQDEDVPIIRVMFLERANELRKFQ